MAASVELVALVAISLVLGLGICSANRPILDGAREMHAAKPPPHPSFQAAPPLPVFHEAGRPGQMKAEASAGAPGLTEVAGKMNQPPKVEDHGSDHSGGDGYSNSFPLSRWMGQALHCSPLECKGGGGNQYAGDGDCGGFSVYFDFGGPGAAFKNKASPTPTAAGIDHPPTAPIEGKAEPDPDA